MGKGDPTCPGWMMTFGDCMSLLLTFFVMLISFTSFDKAKLADFLAIMQGAFNLQQPFREEEASFRLDEDAVARPQLLSREEVAMISPLVPAVKTLANDLLDERFGDQVFFRFSEDGMAIILESSPLYARESDALLPGNERLFRAIGNVVFPIANEIRVTAVVPEDAVFDRRIASSAWSFSARRSLAFVQALARINNLPPDRFGVATLAAPRRERLAWKQTTLSEYVEILVVERRQVQEAQPEEIVIHDRWQ
jgi:chemotaxis protein MotB